MSKLKCQPPSHAFAPASRTCVCGELVVPDLTTREYQQPPGNKRGQRSLERDKALKDEAASKPQHPWGRLGGARPPSRKPQ